MKLAVILSFFISIVCTNSIIEKDLLNHRHLEAEEEEDEDFMLSNSRQSISMTISSFFNGDKIGSDAPARPILNQTLRADVRKKLEGTINLKKIKVCLSLANFN